MLYLLPKATEKMDRHWILGFLRDGSCRQCWLDAWLLHGSAGGQLCVWGGGQVVNHSRLHQHKPVPDSTSMTYVFVPLKHNTIANFFSP